MHVVLLFSHTAAEPIPAIGRFSSLSLSLLSSHRCHSRVPPQCVPVLVVSLLCACMRACCVLFFLRFSLCSQPHKHMQFIPRQLPLCSPVPAVSSSPHTPSHTHIPIATQTQTPTQTQTQ